MSLVTHSKVRDRVYRRVFDHDEAQRLHAEGWSYARLAVRYGVSEAAVGRVCNPRTRERMDENSKKHNRRARVPCRGGCGRLVWMHGRINKMTRTGFCQDCWNASKTAADERPEELRCTKCREWKQDENFTKEKGRKTRRGLKSQCRGCETIARRENRRKNPERERATDRARKRKKRRNPRMANYTVLKMNGSGGWHEVGKVAAGTRLHAVEELADEAGNYIAISEAHMKVLEVASTISLRVVQDS
jgi:hypothetical protein